MKNLPTIMKCTQSNPYYLQEERLYTQDGEHLEIFIVYSGMTSRRRGIFLRGVGFLRRTLGSVRDSFHRIFLYLSSALFPDVAWR